ncbi:MAG TPA: helix-turn-helix transcriptional regulator [Baekduia sp.]|nr:helix-turn-helix transcriptional regulator [Baekduia sp.]
MTSRAPASNSTARSAERIEDLCAAGLPAQELITGVADELRRTLSADSLFVCATDPDTMLGMGAGVVHGMPESVCEPFWAFEFEVPDYNKFTDLAHGPRHAADLHAATGGRPERSARWRELRTLMDADAELRASLTANGRGWGLLHVNRVGGVRGFSEAEVAFVESVGSAIGRGLRDALVSQPADGLVGRGPGMAVFDAENRLVSATTEAIAWFEEIESVRRLPKLPSAVGVPSEVIVAAQEARARAADPGAALLPTRTRARTSTGAWLLIHASCLRAAGGSADHTAVVVEPAKASEVAPLIVEAYELTPREVEVTRAVARGLTTPEVAAELHLSRYTVADHLKSVYEKVGVSTRGELVAKMFADHYHDRLAAAVQPARAAA